MRLQDFAKQSRYVNWSENDFYNLALGIDFEEFTTLEPTTSEKFESDQFEIPVFIIDGKESQPSILATKSKILLSELLSFWSEDQNCILRISKKGSGFYTKYTVVSTSSIYDKASGKIRKQTAKST